MLTLSIGIGATAAVATVANPMFFQPLPVPDPDELVAITQLDEHTSVFPHPLSYPEHLDYRERNDVFEGLAAHAVAEELLSIEGRAAERILIEYVSDNYFDVRASCRTLRWGGFLSDKRRQDAGGKCVWPKGNTTATRVLSASCRSWYSRAGFSRGLAP